MNSEESKRRIWVPVKLVTKMSQNECSRSKINQTNRPGNSNESKCLAFLNENCRLLGDPMLYQSNPSFCEWNVFISQSCRKRLSLVLYWMVCSSSSFENPRDRRCLRAPLVVATPSASTSPSRSRAWHWMGPSPKAQEVSEHQWFVVYVYINIKC